MQVEWEKIEFYLVQLVLGINKEHNDEGLAESDVNSVVTSLNAWKKGL